MTNRHYFVMGWIYGTIVRAAGDRNIGGDLQLVVMHPFSAQADLIRKAHREHLLRGELDMQIAEAMVEIDEIPDGDEPVATMQQQSEWFIGYYWGLGGKPLARESFDIAAARKAKGLTQAQLADRLGLAQGVISRWETGKFSPNKEHLAKLKEILQ